MKPSFGRNIVVSLFGASHAPAVGVVIDGFPRGLEIDFAALGAFLRRRAPGNTPWSSARHEPDGPEFLSGLDGSVTNGRRIKAAIRNRDIRSGDYAKFREIPRPGHADYTAYVKYGEIPAGGGQFSGRMTAPLCIAGGLCLQFLARHGITLRARAKAIGRVTDTSPFTEDVSGKPFPASGGEAATRMIAEINRSRENGDSVGGVVECEVLGLAAGLGGPLFDGMEGRLSEILFAIPAVKGVEFGAGFAAAAMTGAENNDPFAFRNGKVITTTNNCGGLLGGITTGMPLVFRVAIKPTPSIAKTQQSVNLATGEAATLDVEGRHDPCIVPRAVPCVEAAAALAVADALLDPPALRKGEEANLTTYRRQLDQLDAQLIHLFEERMETVSAIGTYKRTHGLAPLDARREAEKLDAVAAQLPQELAAYGRGLFKNIMDLSKDYQANGK